VALAMCIFVTWIIIIVVSVIPKMLSEWDMVSLYFINTILVISTFTVLDLNLEYMTVSDNAEKAIGVMIYRMIAIPLVLIISANVSRYAAKFVRFVILAGIDLILIVFLQVIKGMGMITLIHWNFVDSAIMFTCFIAFSSCMAWVIVSAGKKEETNHV
jgi:hypothetical protein